MQLPLSRLRVKLNGDVFVAAGGQLCLRHDLSDHVGADLGRLTRLAMRSDVLREVVAAHELLAALIASELKRARSCEFTRESLLPSSLPCASCDGAAAHHCA